MRRCLHATLLTTVLLMAQPLGAHHSTSAIFENDKRITVSGTLTKVDWINPHIVIFVESGSGPAAETWRIQGNPPAWWRTVGVNRADFAKGMGQNVTVDALPALDGSRYGYLRRIRFANGDSLESMNTL